ncbi:DUF2273 domain-containing protein [Paenibacillus albiflavus]|uniref:DUF2273 domain-containing protein n=1 Tax=Paenibacillus albiflavus TaxID=2545760 RepID=UPI001A9F7A72|nr:DUF2273 domain-containing protein [Paenibacillus albiflavus]
MWNELWTELWQSHRGKLLGVIGGIICGILYLIVGFWDTMIFAFIVTVGYYIGSKVEKKEDIVPFQDIVNYLSQKWKMFR